MQVEKIYGLVSQDKESLSISGTVKITEYLSFIEAVYKSKGGIDGQRSPLKSKTAIQIRNRMKHDIKNGAILPAIVIGLVADEKIHDQLIATPVAINEHLKDFLMNNNVSLIDGMQRTTALHEIQQEGVELSYFLKIEFWIAKSVNNLIYRMLILNTAQIPWSLKRQLEVVFSSLSNQIKSKIGYITLFQEDDRSRRSKGGEYQESDIIELYLCFSVRKLFVDTRESLTEEFSRLDIIEATSDKSFTNNFIDTLKLMVELDKTFSDIKLQSSDDSSLERFKSGYHIFSSQPSRVGFVTAFSLFIFGRPGISIELEQANIKLKMISMGITELISNLNALKPEEKYEFICLPTLDEMLNVKTAKIGDFEREFFLKAYTTLADMIYRKETIKNLDPLWRSY
ncbi:hypothetical protein HGB47_16400 [Leptospira yasudae]|uniref:hypothetical protein n=1 Tax=Leptospira yasudae TaxID=2202201 RepID=UPI001C502130|nr:hypothetical protein [Leptospira yasudae]MBW0435194.1 hypothetical protein [Leptospira yasudae]